VSFIRSYCLRTTLCLTLFMKLNKKQQNATLKEYICDDIGGGCLEKSEGLPLSFAGNRQKKSSFEMETFVVVCLIVVPIVLIVLFVGICCYCRYRRRYQENREWDLYADYEAEDPPRNTLTDDV